MIIHVLQWYVGLSGQANVDSGHRHPGLAFSIPQGAPVPQFHEAQHCLNSTGRGTTTGPCGRRDRREITGRKKACHL